MRRYFMVNGPLGGNMGTPPVPPQPPQVSFTTTAESRGGFNNFLKSIPQTTNMTPIPPLGSAPTAPMSNPMGNIDIFNQPPSMGMGMMGMNQPQMQQPMQQPMNMGVGLMGTPVQNFYNGGYADSDFGGFSDYGSVDATSDDGFSEDDDDNNNYNVDDSGVYTGDNSSNMGLDDDVVAQNIIQNALNEGINQSTTQDSGSNNVNIAPRINSQIMGSEEDIFQDDINRGIAGSLTNREAANMMPNASNFGSRVAPNIAGAFRGGNNASLLGPEDALIDAITKGKSDSYAPFTNNPGNLKQAREDLTTETIKGFNADGTPRTGPALFNTLEAGQKALDDQLSRYGNRGINTATDFVNTYLGTDIKENPLENKQGYLSAVNNAVGSKFDLSNAATRGNLMNAIARQELGQKGINALNNQVTSATGLDLTSLTPSNTRDIVDDAYTADVPQVRTSITPDVVGSTDAELNAMDRAITNTQRANEIQNQLANVNDQTLADRLQNQRGLDRNISTTPDTALETMAGRRDILPDQVYDFNTNVMDRNPVDTSLEIINPSASFLRSEADRKNATLDRDANVRDMDDIDIATAGRASDFPTLSTSTVPEDFEENVGRPFDAKRMEDIERLYGVNTGQAGYGTGPIPNFRDTSKFQGGQDPTFLEGLGVPTPVTIFGDAIERKTRENMANEIALGRPMGLGETFFGFNAPNIGMGKTKATDQETIQQYNERTGRSIPGNQIIRNDSGRVIGIRDASGRLVSGMDPNAPMDTGNDNNENPLILRPIAKAPEEEKEEEKLPNVIGGGETPAPVSSGSVVVDSPFTSNVGNFIPSSFNTGELNKLIEALTGVASPKAMKQGGVAGYAEGGRVMQALDNLLATG